MRSSKPELAQAEGGFGLKTTLSPPDDAASVSVVGSLADEAESAAMFLKADRLTVALLADDPEAANASAVLRRDRDQVSYQVFRVSSNTSVKSFLYLSCPT